MNEQSLLDFARAVLGGAAVKEIKMFGGIGFMLNGNLLIAVSRRGLLARVGKEAQDDALMRPGATPMVMCDRLMSGYIRVDMSALDEGEVASWVHMARLFVQTLPKRKSTPKEKSARKKKPKPKAKLSKTKRTR